jgi:sporulation protein YlmC with PRC-barrel domain
MNIMAIRPLSELDNYKLSHTEQDCCGWHVVNASGIQIGTVQDMLVDTEHERVTAVVLESGVQIPVEEITLLDGLVVVAESHLAGAIVTPPRPME